MDVVHDPDHSRFVVSVDGNTAEIQYARVGDDVLDLRHTEVPPELQHRGVGDALAIGAFDYARANGLRLVLTCPFLRRWILSHPEQRDIVLWNRGGKEAP
jgi:predicted GNAT family acetyltransferase